MVHLNVQFHKKISLSPFARRLLKPLFLSFAVFSILLGGLFLIIPYVDDQESLHQQTTVLAEQKNSIQKQFTLQQNHIADLEQQITALKTDQEYLKNAKLNDQLTSVKKTYLDAKDAYESLITLEEANNMRYDKLDAQFAQVLSELSQYKYEDAAKTIGLLTGGIEKTQADIAAAAAAAAAKAVAAQTPSSNTAPDSGYSHQLVSAAGQQFVVDIIAGNLSSTKVIVETASDGDCGNNCPVLPLGEYVRRNNAYAGVNGGYFCPSTYPTCQGKTNSFDTLLMNKNKVYFNSANNVYSVVPAVIFLGSSVRFVERSLDWGRDTGVDSVIANQPLLVYNGDIKFTGGSDPKQTGKGSRGFVGNKGNTVYIGMAHNVTVAEMAQVLKALSFDNAINLDSGGSSALWVNGGYRVGPGRDLPNVILFVRR